MRFDNPIYSHEFTFPDIANFPDTFDQPVFFDTNESDYDLHLMRNCIQEKNGPRFINLLNKYYQGPKSLRGNILKYFQHVTEFADTRVDMDMPDNQVHESLYEQGVWSTYLDTSTMQQLAMPIADQLLEQPDWQPPPGIFDRLQKAPKQLVREVKEQFAETGILQGATKYLSRGRNLKVSHVVIHVATPTDSNWKQFLYDCDTVTRTTHLHIDPKEDVVKSMIYLNDIDRHSGAFSYIPYSNRWIHDPLQEVFGRAITTGSYCHNKESRAPIFNLPSHLRVSYNFGRTLLDNDVQQQMLLDQDVYDESEQANCVVFDPAGMHRGGQCTTGNRIALQVIMK